jgi:hypothetical protein
MRRWLLLVALPLLLLVALSVRAALRTIDPQDGPVTRRVGTEFTFFITVTAARRR